MSNLGPVFDVIIAVWIGLFGLCVGSFLNVVIYRVPEELSIVKPRSRCPRCGHQLAWFENIPVFSWLALRGKCRSCKAPISFRYPMIELLTGLLFLATLQRFGLGWELGRGVILVGFLVALTFIGLDHWLLPHELTWPGIAVGLLSAPLLGLPALRDAAIGAAVGYLSFWAMEWVGEKIFKKEALGAGDKYLLALIGAFLGWQAILGVIFLSSLQGAVVGSLLLLVRGRAGPAPEIAPDSEETVEPKPAGAEAVIPPANPIDPASAAESPAGSQEDEEEDDWVPGPTNIPFGPWLSLAALELLLLGPWLASVAPEPLSLLVLGQPG